MLLLSKNQRTECFGSLVALFLTTPALESHLECLTQILLLVFASCQKDAVVGIEDLLSYLKVWATASDGVMQHHAINMTKPC